MSVISIRLPDDLLHDLENNAQTMHLNRAEYIRKAIDYMNRKILIQIRKKQLANASLRVRKESMRVNQEFSEFEFDDEDTTG